MTLIIRNQQQRMTRDRIDFEWDESRQVGIKRQGNYESDVNVGIDRHRND